jgi:hypothetical protein
MQAAEVWRTTEAAPHILQPPQQRIIPVDAQGRIDAHHSDWLGTTITGFSIGGAAAALSTLGMRKLAEATGNQRVLDDMNWLSGGCCPVIANYGYSFAKDERGEPVYGIAGALHQNLAHIPRKVEQWLGIAEPIERALSRIASPLGDALQRDEVKLALAGGALTLIGHMGGKVMERVNRTTGRIVRNTLQAFGVILTLPALLPGIGHAAMVTSTVLGLEDLDKEHYRSSGPGSHIAAILGKPPGNCLLEHGKRENSTISGSVLALCCGIPMLIAAIPGIMAGITSHRNTGASR